MAIQLLSLFPAHVKFTDAKGFLTAEGYRSLQRLFERVGSSLGDFDFNSLNLVGNAVIGGTLSLSPGTAALPSLFWGNNNSTGFYRIAANNVGYSVSGVNLLSLAAGGLTVSGTTTSTSFTGAGTGLTGTAPSLTAGNVTTNANLTGMVTSIGNATTVVTNANLTGMVTSIGNATTVVTNADLTGPITSVGNATSIASQTGTGSTFVMDTNPTLVTPVLGNATATSLQSPIGTITPNTGAFTSVSANLHIEAEDTNVLTRPAVSARFNSSNNRIGFNIAHSSGFGYLSYNANPKIGSDTATYDITDESIQLRLSNGEYTFNSAPSGTAGTDITWTTIATMTIAAGLSINPVGSGLRVAEGSNAKQGTAVLVAGVAVVANTSVTANSRIFLTSQVDGGTPGFLRVSARTASTSFTITSSSITDTSTVAYQIFEPA